MSNQGENQPLRLDVSSGGVELSVRVGKPWRTPRVIVSDLQDASAGNGPSNDGHSSVTKHS